MYNCNIATPRRNGDIDAVVITHEFGHGISIRQVGGPGNSGCLSNVQQPGEGWSDWLGLVYTATASDAARGCVFTSMSWIFIRISASLLAASIRSPGIVR